MNEALRRALELSRRLAEIAAGRDGDGDGVDLTADLDAERRRLLESVRADLASIDAEGRRMLQEIIHLNDHSIGTLEHRLRAKARDLDIAVAGSRALHAYSATGPAGR